MAKQKRATASVKMSYTEDADLIDWWNSLPRGSRNAIMKDMMRDYIERNRGSYRPIYPRNQPQPFDPKYFMQLVDDVAWTRAALVDLPGYVERVIQYVTAPGIALNNAAYNGVPSNAAISDDSAHRREQRMKRTQW